ncbi:uncharacterized protein LOC131982813 [Centropristis striata]|uniref:uncharacterized protein LOC131982813 n=1 Tax=Centropristis striata TaxID=184440 RepID=UPI0027DEBE4B|nr:uncharacterized protein LOC131982813 [Centropristis striata]
MSHHTYFPANEEPVFPSAEAYDCPCCPFWTRQHHTIVYHLRNHLDAAVRHGEYRICKCSFKCRDAHHFHCLTCDTTIIRRNHFIAHLKVCTVRSVPKRQKAASVTQSPVAASVTQSPVAASVTQSPVAASVTQSPAAASVTQSPAAASVTQSPVVASVTQSSATVTQIPVAAPAPAAQPQMHVHRQQQVKIKCVHCGLTLNRCNLRVHIKRKHSGKKDITDEAATVTESPVAATVTESPVAATVTESLVGATITESPVAATVTESLVGATVTESPVGATITESPVAATVTESLVGATITESPVAAPAPAAQPQMHVHGQQQVKIKCVHCGLKLNRRNLRVHIKRKHSGKKDITAERHLSCQCIDPQNGIFAVKKTFTGPIHVIKKTSGTNLQVRCEMDLCKANAELAERSNCLAFECDHLRSLTYHLVVERCTLNM